MNRLNTTRTAKLSRRNFFGGGLALGLGSLTVRAPRLSLPAFFERVRPSPYFGHGMGYFQTWTTTIAPGPARWAMCGNWHAIIARKDCVLPDGGYRRDQLTDYSLDWEGLCCLVIRDLAGLRTCSENGTGSDQDDRCLSHFDAFRLTRCVMSDCHENGTGSAQDLRCLPHLHAYKLTRCVRTDCPENVQTTFGRLVEWTAHSAISDVGRIGPSCISKYLLERVLSGFGGTVGFDRQVTATPFRPIDMVCLWGRRPSGIDFVAVMPCRYADTETVHLDCEALETT